MSCQSPGAPEDDPRDGFDLGGWLPPHFDEQTGPYMNEVFDQAQRTEPFLGWVGRLSHRWRCCRGDNGRAGAAAGVCVGWFPVAPDEAVDRDPAGDVAQ